MHGVFDAGRFGYRIPFLQDEIRMTSAEPPCDNPPADLAGFEKDLESLECLVERMEQGELPLETALQEFERGIALTRRCQQALQQAEQKVRQLTGEDAETDFDTPAPPGPDGED